jgi:hypothetical protein
MYATSVYLAPQLQTILLVDTTGSYFDRRWAPVYAKNLKLNLGVDNVILFQFHNQDQKPVNISGATFTFRMITQDGEQLIIAKDLVILNAATGRARVTITAEETDSMIAQPASWSISVSSGVLDQAVFVDDYAGARGVIDIVDSVYPMFRASPTLTVPDQAPDSSLYYTSTLQTQGSRSKTFQIDPSTFTGTVTVQGASDTADQWYSIDFVRLDTGSTVSELAVTASSERFGINVSGFHPYLRIGFEISSGSIQQILYR